MPVFSRIALTITLALLVSGCVTRGGTAQGPAQPEPAQVRAEQRWAALIERDAAAAYQYFTPAYRAINTEQAYTVQVKNARTGWKSAEVTSHECPEEDRCVVRVKVGFELVNLLPGVARHESTQTVDETWLKVDDAWYFLPAR